jgi:two-component system sensor histidine kinase EvgS
VELLSLTHLDHEQHATLGVVRESGKSLLRIIDDILDFSKIEAGKLDLVPEPTSVREVVERVWRMYMGAASSKGLLLKRFYDARISPAVMADPVRLQQVLGNFVSNAIKFTPTGGASVSAELIERAEGRDVVQFTVSDSGIGLAEEQQARLFQPFMQANDNVAAEYGGTGLGLAISRRIAAMMGGTIRMESEPGHGTRLIFTVPLPIADGEAKVEAGPAASKPIAVRKPPSVEEAERQRTLVLVVDDHPVNRMVLLRQVNALGYAAETAEDGRDALGKWSTGRFAAVITDCNMPEMSGYELARSIRAREVASPHARTTIIACTANALGGEAEKCFAAGMDDYLAKPVVLDQLAEKLAHCLPLAHRVNGSRPIDLEVLSEISGGDPELNRELLARFQRYNAEDAENLREAARQKDLAQLVAYSHRIKGASKTIGATGLALVCEEIERSGHAQDMDSLMSHLRRFDTEVERLDEYIRTDPGND